MSTKQEAKTKITAAEKGCSKVQAEWVAADKALGGSVSTNGYGIYSDRFELRDKLELARKHINEALMAMDSIDWPTNAEYDLM
jgi:hypothetical protein